VAIVPWATTSFDCVAVCSVAHLLYASDPTAPRDRERDRFGATLHAKEREGRTADASGLVSRMKGADRGGESVPGWAGKRNLRIY
jgi:hypothetical protein